MYVLAAALVIVCALAYTPPRHRRDVLYIIKLFAQLLFNGRHGLTPAQLANVAPRYFSPSIELDVGRPRVYIV